MQRKNEVLYRQETDAYDHIAVHQLGEKNLHEKRREKDKGKKKTDSYSTIQDQPRCDLRWEKGNNEGSQKNKAYDSAIQQIGKKRLR